VEVKEITIQAINPDQMKPEDIFTWLEQFSFIRYGERNRIDPSKTDDPRYPSGLDESPIDWYTFLHVPSQYYDQNCVIIGEEMYEKLKAAFKEKIHLKENKKDAES